MADDRATQTVHAPGDELIEVPSVLPVLPVRDVVIYPGGTVPLQVGRPGSLAALEEAGHGGFVLIGTQHDPNIEEPTLEDLYAMGTIGRVVRVLDAREGGKQALVVGVCARPHRSARGVLSGPARGRTCRQRSSDRHPRRRSHLAARRDARAARDLAARRHARRMESVHHRHPER